MSKQLALAILTLRWCILGVVAEGSSPFNCAAGAKSWRFGWSEEKKAYCCKHYAVGCASGAERAPSHSSASQETPWPFSQAESVKHNHSHSASPWWIVAGVTPSGPETDYGSYTALGFSKDQQRQFGVDARGQIKNWSRFTAAMKAMQPCIDPHDKQMGLDQAGLMHVLGHALEDAWAQVKRDDPLLESWTKLRSPCQRTCMTRVLSWSLRTLWATGELLARGGGRIFSRALGDAVRACYPGFRTLRADEVADKVSELVSERLEKQIPVAAARADFEPDRRLEAQDGPTCLEPGDSDDGARGHFLLKLEMAVDHAMTTAEMRSWTLMEQASRPCQKTCRRAVVRQAAEMLWDTGLLSRGNSDELTITSLQGGLSACLPNLPRDAGEALAGEALLRFQRLDRSQLHGIDADGLEGDVELLPPMGFTGALSTGSTRSKALGALAGAVSLSGLVSVLLIRAKRRTSDTGDDTLIEEPEVE